ncbi:dihydrolipoamide acetyltransferase family protein [Tropheryma whipplei]|uniref:dihydrolipoamide acetyltransferase family protein n=1 Tax=Tropheryma whipplei TaxID=2039 RepID=UPI0004B43C73|nr:dihydrolipoamide acetyltransferase family protein [Tropheryma whipplei]MCO8190462.1 2-oxo acid dehydrogenase subunit E2 [Tropheryma whipplei]
MPEVTFLLTDPGEGLVEAEIVSLRVTEGDAVDVNQIVVEVETAKSLVELPSPFKGVVRKLLVAVGELVKVGSPIMLIDTDETPPAGLPKTGKMPVSDVRDGGHDTAKNTHPRDTGSSKDIHDAFEKEDGREIDFGRNVLVGYGPCEDNARVRGDDITGRPSLDETLERPVAKPSVRKFAKELGVDLYGVKPTGIGGTITRRDVLNATSTQEEATTRVPVKGLRRQTAQNVTLSAFSVPHVSVFVDVDVTRTIELVDRLKRDPLYEQVRISPLLILSRAVTWAVKRSPIVNSTWSEQEILLHKSVNLGIAVATDRGLVVPNIKNAQCLSMLDLAKAIESLVDDARSSRIRPEDTLNGTITITNIGVFGVDSGTPILNVGESSIVFIGAIKPRPWVVNGEISVRRVATIGGSFDHRVMDGDTASRFLVNVASILEEPALLVE